MTKVVNGDKKKNWFAKHKILTVILGFVLIMIIAGAAGGGDKKDAASTTNGDSTAATSDDKTDAKPAETAAKIGVAARDGKFEFVVNSIKCGETTVGTNQYLQSKASGQFCRLNLTIKNIGDKSQSMFADSQKLLSSDNKEFSYDSEATIYATTDAAASSWYNEINPGVTVSGEILFDVPTGVTPVTAVLHDSSFSNGVKVSLQ